MAPNAALKSSELLRLPTPPPSAALFWPASGVAALASPTAAAAAPPPNAAFLLPYTCTSCQRQILDKVSCVCVCFRWRAGTRALAYVEVTSACVLYCLLWELILLRQIILVVPAACRQCSMWATAPACGTSSVCAAPSVAPSSPSGASRRPRNTASSAAATICGARTLHTYENSLS